MTEGILAFPDGDRTLHASVSPEGWSCAADPGMAHALTGAFPFPSTEAGEPWMLAFREAVQALGATVVQEPEPDPCHPDAPHD